MEIQWLVVMNTHFIQIYNKNGFQSKDKDNNEESYAYNNKWFIFYV